MNPARTILTALTCCLTLPQAFAQTAPQTQTQTQTPCTGSTLTGSVVDTTLALIPSATLTLDATRSTTSASDGTFHLPCVAPGSHQIVIAAAGFATRTTTLSAPHAAAIQLILDPETVQTHVDVDDTDTPPSTMSTGASPTLSGAQLHSLADDPDDLLRQLQQLASAGGGGNPANITISVDGFQGSSTLPPKKTIAYIRVNPDQFSAEYRQPPFGGGRIEVYTKPGAKAFHGALFATNGSTFMNARDPFSTSKAPLGKQRYGFELTGPVRKANDDFTLTLEHRSIDNFAVVNAITLDPTGNPLSVVANVSTPQRLWLGSARYDLQLGTRNTAIISYTARSNALQNVGVGGTALAETGYNSQQYEHVLHLTNITTVSPHFMHETRVGLRWDGSSNTPTSTAPQLQVAGAFLGGGNTLGAQQIHEFDLEIDDDAILTTHTHTFKFGTQWESFHELQQLPSSFNGTYTFGGGTAPVLNSANTPIPGQTQTITGLEQYRRALLKLPGGSPTAFSNVAGTPTVRFNLITNALFFQDDWNVGHGIHIAYGLRYYLESNPSVLNAVTPRLGIVWSPTKNGTWTLHAHAGLFSGRFGPKDTAEIFREDGTQRVTSTVYNPVFGDPLTNATPIHSLRALSPHIAQLTWYAENIGGTRSLPHGWNLSADLYLGRLWNYGRTVNINAPLNGQPTGPRALGIPNLNILQVQNSGQGKVNAEFFGIEQHTLKRIQFFFGGVHVNLFDDTDDQTFFTPQSSFSDAGEFARRTDQPAWNLFGNGTLHLPRKVELSGDFHANGPAPYNITTGFDNNGDGNFNDRPQFAAPGAPGAISTPFGLLTSSGGTGVFPRNQGRLPWTFYLDSNLQRAFLLTHNPKAEHQQTLTLNLRSANLLNHTNVTQVGGVLGSPLFGRAFAADTGRRIEAGLRYSF